MTHRTITLDDFADAGNRNEGIGHQLSWLSHAVDRLDKPAAPTKQATFEGWST